MMQNVKPDSARKMLVQLLGQSADGNRAAFENLYILTSAKLYGTCLRILGDHSLAEDALQDAFIKIWHNADRFDADRSSPITWLATIARNTAIDRKRKGANRQMVSEKAIEHMETDEKSALQKLQDRESDDRLNRCLDNLEARQSHAIRTAFFEGLSYNELANQIDEPLGTVKSWVRRGLQRLKDCMDDG